MHKTYSLLAVLVLAGLLSVSSTQAQNATNSNARPTFTIGPLFTAGASVFTGDVPQGLKTDARFAFNGGILTVLNTIPNFGFQLGLTYDSRAMNLHAQNDAEILTNYTFTYFNVQPGMKFKDFILGLGIGIPMSGSAQSAIHGATGTSEDIATSRLNTMLEVRLGAEVPVFEASTSDLRFLIVACYPFTKTFADSFTSTTGNGAIATLQAGFSYQFGLGN
jgi:hypothetical protein